MIVDGIDYIDGSPGEMLHWERVLELQHVLKSQLDAEGLAGVPRAGRLLLGAPDRCPCGLARRHDPAAVGTRALRGMASG